MYVRYLVLTGSIFLAFVSLSLRLFYWQIVKGEELSERARQQQQVGRALLAPRGNILANDGSFLAARTDAYLLYTYLPQITGDKSKIADTLAPFLIKKSGGVLEKELVLDEANRLKRLLGSDDKSWVPLAGKITPDLRRQIEVLEIEGIGFDLEEQRTYPEASAAAHILGFVGKSSAGEDKGYFGLEGYYDHNLSGKKGYVKRESDARGVPILAEDSLGSEAVAGVDLLTFIDKPLQILVDRKLKEGIVKYGAKAGTVLVMNPKTGGILASSSFPSYDPEDYADYGDEYFIDPTVSLSFEPGSIFKVIIMASALDSESVEPDTKCEACAGPVKIDKYVIETWDQNYFPNSSMTDVIVHSDNVGMVYVGKKIGKERLYDYLRSFGFGSLTGIDLQGEVTPELREKGAWGDVDLATVSFGQGIAVTPVQMLAAVSAIADGGILKKPKVVYKIESGDWSEEINNDLGRRVISEKSAAQITAMMVEAAKKGESKWTHLRGFKVAGKTGTAQIPIAGHYDAEKTIASFVGFAPASDPKFVMLVTLREPTSSPWASETAAPLWYSIAKDIFPYMGIVPGD